MTLRNWYENVSVPSPLMWDNAEVYFILFPIKAQFPISGGGLNTALFFGCLSFPVSLSVWTQIFLGPPTLEFLPEVFIPAFLRISTSGRDSKMGSLVGWLAKRRPLLVEVQWWEPLVHYSITVTKMLTCSELGWNIGRNACAGLFSFQLLRNTAAIIIKRSTDFIGIINAVMADNDCLKSIITSQFRNIKWNPECTYGCVQRDPYLQLP